MAEQLVTGSIAAPGFSGLNTQDSSIQLDSGFALEAYNCVIDKYGRIGARKGWTKVNPTALASSAPIRTVFEFVKSDNNLTFAAGGNKIYGTHPVTGAYVEYPVGGTLFHAASAVSYSQTGTTVSVTCSSHGYSTGNRVYFGPTSGTADEGIYTVTVTSGSAFTFTSPSSETTSGAANLINIISYTISDDNWQCLNMPLGTGNSASAHAIWLQANQPPLVMHKLGTPPHTHVDGYGFQRLGDIATFSNGYTVSDFMPSCGIYAFGRLWVANVSANDTQTVYFSDLQDPSNWTTGTAGKLDISAVIPTGDPIVALAQHNGFLIIFCKKHIVIYSGAGTPSTITLSDTITGVGCIARDSVQSVAGTDILFLSETGVQSLQRLVQEKSLPFRDVSKNVRDELITLVNSETLANIKAVYYPTDAFYLLSLPGTGFAYCFDTRGVLQNGAARTTIWKQIAPTAFCMTSNRELYTGQKGYIGKYDGYQDNTSTYRMSYFTNYFDFGSATTNKILKRINVTAIGGSAQPIAIKWGYDYTRNYFSRGIVLQRVEVYEYGTAEYNRATYTNGIALDIANIPASGSGTVLQLGFESDINGTPLSIQKIDFFLKQGKTL
jgi:hypothetical protein